MLLMPQRVGNASGRTLNDASLQASAISNYYREIGDRNLADRWDEMSEDLALTSAGRPMMAPGTRRG